MEEPELTIANGSAAGVVDTGGDRWGPGTYYIDVRFTDPDGNDHWSETYQIILKDRNTPKS